MLVVQLLDGEGLGLIALADIQHALVYFNQALLKRGVLLSDDSPVADGRKAVADVFDNTPAHNGVARVDTKYSQIHSSVQFQRYPTMTLL